MHNAYLRMESFILRCWRRAFWSLCCALFAMATLGLMSSTLRISVRPSWKRSRPSKARPRLSRAFWLFSSYWRDDSVGKIEGKEIEIGEHHKHKSTEKKHDNPRSQHPLSCGHHRWYQKLTSNTIEEASTTPLWSCSCCLAPAILL